jgi:hypothetical protein
MAKWLASEFASCREKRGGEAKQRMDEAIRRFDGVTDLCESALVGWK